MSVVYSAEIGALHMQKQQRECVGLRQGGVCVCSCQIKQCAMSWHGTCLLHNTPHKHTHTHTHVQHIQHTQHTQHTHNTSAHNEERCGFGGRGGANSSVHSHTWP